jgi:hypothetical protein
MFVISTSLLQAEWVKASFRACNRGEDGGVVSTRLAPLGRCRSRARICFELLQTKNQQRRRLNRLWVRWIGHAEDTHVGRRELDRIPRAGSRRRLHRQRPAGYTRVSDLRRWGAQLNNGDALKADRGDSWPFRAADRRLPRSSPVATDPRRRCKRKSFAKMPTKRLALQ